MDRDPFAEVDDALGMDGEELHQRAEEARRKREQAAWPEPEPLTSADAEPQPYPLDALPTDVAAGIAEYQRYGMQPVALIAGWLTFLIAPLWVARQVWLRRHPRKARA